MSRNVGRKKRGSQAIECEVQERASQASRCGQRVRSDFNRPSTSGIRRGVCPRSGNVFGPNISQQHVGHGQNLSRDTGAHRVRIGRDRARADAELEGEDRVPATRARNMQQVIAGNGLKI
eukprot:851820-Pleurochrysis_carterae.AAC.1